ncbi:hypothetical protein AGABI2DRAFT_142720 [Agaricus bisporus var. bisporus H97]|uniref:hypothetical protein n=1 Tax=Agaricus bisporus var. bisporus (strain H97 / ATCC MYA-4626 / FGSC 10389) TaxID=936046 RepID=UPI00029F6187|nr:hypothetical protein AGABI2DRAFT_142720 [Agaricus bisporus var. bisporus H97]EKV48645.1 hypothetical protein AGABI2DRAFT_142720 [Agaricus bisporus var. bisporus H97]
MDDAIDYLQSSHPSLLGNDAPDLAADSADEVPENQSSNYPLPHVSLIDNSDEFYEFDFSAGFTEADTEVSPFQRVLDYIEWYTDVDTDFMEHSECAKNATQSVFQKIRALQDTRDVQRSIIGLSFIIVGLLESSKMEGSASSDLLADIQRFGELDSELEDFLESLEFSVRRCQIILEEILMLRQRRYEFVKIIEKKTWLCFRIWDEQNITYTTSDSDC